MFSEHAGSGLDRHHARSLLRGRDPANERIARRRCRWASVGGRGVQPFAPSKSCIVPAQGMPAVSDSSPTVKNITYMLARTAK
jgi:hypothetical protein